MLLDSNKFVGTYGRRYKNLSWKLKNSAENVTPLCKLIETNFQIFTNCETLPTKTQLQICGLFASKDFVQ